MPVTPEYTLILEVVCLMVWLSTQHFLLPPTAWCPTGCTVPFDLSFVKEIKCSLRKESSKKKGLDKVREPPPWGLRFVRSVLLTWVNTSACLFPSLQVFIVGEEEARVTSLKKVAKAFAALHGKVLRSTSISPGVGLHG